MKTEKQRKKVKGFTLVELVIVIAIVIVLSVISVPIYNNYTRKAKMTEGYALLSTILSAQKAYYSEYGNFLLGMHTTTHTSNEIVLGIDARGNKYFTWITMSYSPASRAKYEFFAGIFKPSDLINKTESLLALFYNITTGATYKDW